MKREFIKKTAAVLACSAFMVYPFQNIDVQPSYAADLVMNFDLGANAEGGYISVSASQGYDKSKGYGFSNTAGVKDVAASGGGALSDAVQFTDVNNSQNTFNVDLPNGLYRVEVTLGNTNRTSIYMENSLQIVNMTGNNAYDSILIPVTDGQLNIRAAAGKEGYPFSISALKITKVSDDAELPPTVWFCGDSTVCNYYPLDTSVQAGWGQLFSKYIDSSWNVRNMASSGQFAKGFMTSGQFETIEKYGKAGDIYIISIGINDTNPNYTNETEYYESVTEMVKRASAKGMKVILVKQQGRSTDVTNNPNLTGRWFGGTLDKIGKEQNVQVIDLFNLFFDYCKSIGQEATTALYMDGDTLHPNRKGAEKLAELASSQIKTDGGKEGAVIDESAVFMIRNKNSNLYMKIDGNAENNSNVSQQTSTGSDDYGLWHVKSAGEGYYYIYSKTAGGEKYLLDLSYGKADNGTNIGIYENTNSDAQLFKFIQNSDGSYCIVTKSSNDRSAIEVKNAYTDSGANIQQFELNGHDCQSWFLEPISAGIDSISSSTGDINNDGVIDIFDDILAKHMMCQNDVSRQEKRMADTNADGDFDKKDCLAMKKRILLDEPFEADKNCSSFYYAIDETFSKGIKENINDGFKNEAYINLDNCEGSFIEWNVNAQEKGNYLCTFKVANGSASNRQMRIYVNGESSYRLQDFLPTNAWTQWNEVGIVLPLEKGKNVIRTTSAMNEGGPNIDWMKIEKTEEPAAEIYIEDENNPPSDDITEMTTIFIAGDSTVQTYRASYAPQQGWGAYLGNYVDNVNVANHAIAGRSSKSFYDNGRLDTILNSMKSGDYLLVQFGINDSAYNNAERYAPVCNKIPGDDGSFEYYIAKYIEGALDKGGKPVLVTTVLGLKAYNQSTGKFEGSYQNYCDAMKKLAAHYNIPCIDLNTLMVNHYNAIGYDKAYTYHLISTELSDTDMTHFTETGAAAVAELVANELNDIMK